MVATRLSRDGVIGRKAACLAVLVVAIALLPRPAQAAGTPVVDGSAIAQRLAQFTQLVIQFRQIYTSSKAHYEAFRAAYEGLKDWRNLGWVDTLRVIDMPWFDNVEGIDDIRRATTLTVMSAEQTMRLWDDASGFEKWKANPRWKTDPWFRAKVLSLMRQSKRARATRTALLRQMAMQNRQLGEDVKKVKRLRDEIEKANRPSDGKPVDTARIASLQAELSAVEARYQGENLILKNQQAIIFLVGEEEAQSAYLETRDGSWEIENLKRMRAFGQGFAR